MANEKRLDLIDRKALLEELDKFANPMPNKSGYDFLCGIATAITEIEDAPTVDAVEVVRCKDCKYCIDTSASSTNIACSKGVNWRAVEPYHFCSYGERREENGC
jgi:hypothetical protein